MTRAEGGLLTGKRGLILGVANARSLAWGIAVEAYAHGAQLALSYQDARLARKVEPLAEAAQARVYRCDVTQADQLDALFGDIEATWGGLDFLIHSLAYAPASALGAPYSEISAEAFAQTLEISAHSLASLTRRAAPLMLNGGGGAIVALTYLGASRVVPHYGVMGPAKAALEASVRALSLEWAPRGVRLNALSAGPVRTLAAAGIPGFKPLLKAASEASPLGRAITPKDVGRAAVFLVSDLSEAVIGEVLHVDGGFHMLGLAGLG
ncbi:enoyl-ACP reductase [Myxococcota bacterium]|nr:enoyl-ACP reductase [Myxococcota bacterium]MBU1897975.1 enoyl-ACP reductase [Myxococcota bacterium]